MRCLQTAVELHVILIGDVMNKFNLLCLVGLMVGCAAVPVPQTSVESLKEKHKLSENFVEVNNCFIYGLPSFNSQIAGVCGITNSEIVVMAQEQGKAKNEHISKSIKFNEIQKIGYKSKIRLHQFQFVSKQELVVITMSPNKQLADADLTKKWYSFIVSKGVKEFTPEMYLQPAQTYYQIRYQ